MEPTEKIWTKKFITLTFINLLLFIGFQMLMPTIPIHLQEMGATDTMIGLIAGVFTFSTIISRFFSGHALDKVGQKPILIIGFIIFIVAALSYSFIPTLGIFMLFRFLHGFGWGSSGTSTNTIASSIVPHSRFAEGIGYFSFSTSLGMAVGPAIGIAFLAVFGFRSLTILSSGLIFLALLMSLTFQFDKTTIQTPTPKKTKIPLQKESLRPTAVMLCASVTYGTIVSFISLYGVQQGISNIGLYFTVYACVMLISRPLSGKIIDRYGYDFTIVGGLVMMIFSLVILSKAQTIGMFLASAVLYGIGFGSLHPSLQTMAVCNIARDSLGAANATFFTGLDIGIAVGSMLFGKIASLIGYANMYLSSVSFAVLALILYFTLARKTGLSCSRNK